MFRVELVYSDLAEEPLSEIANIPDAQCSGDAKRIMTEWLSARCSTMCLRSARLMEDEHEIYCQVFT